MAGWIARKLRAGRYSMNLQLLEADVAASSVPQRAAIVVAAAAMMEKLRTDDFMSGTLLSRAILEPQGTTPDAAQEFYNSIEDVLITAEAQRKQVVKHVAARMFALAASEFDQQAQLQQQGMRLLLVALARKVDQDFGPKAHKLREPLYSAQDQIPNAVAQLQQRDKITAAIVNDARGKNYDTIKTTAELFGFTFIGW